MSERAIEVLREAQRLLADLTGDNTKQSIQHLWARAVEVEVKARAALAAADRVAAPGWNEAIEAAAKIADAAEKLGSESAAVIAMEIRALTLSPGKVSEEL